MTSNDALVWIDCEMTGLNLSADCLIEVAVIVTDAQLNVLDNGIDLIIKPIPGALEQMNEFVTNMHTSSGLIDELADGLDVHEAEQQVLDYIKRFIPEPNKGLLAGNSVGTDKMFLEKQMPKVIDHLHYRIIDVSTIKELAKRWLPRTYFNTPDKAMGHRALADIQESIMELRYYRSILCPGNGGPSTDECKEVSAKVASFPVSVDDGWADYIGQLTSPTE